MIVPVTPILRLLGGRHSPDAALLQPLAAPFDPTLHAGPISGALPLGGGDRHSRVQSGSFHSHGGTPHSWMVFVGEKSDLG